MATVTYLYIPDQVVWVITSDSVACPTAIRTGVVLRVRIEVLATGTTISYDVQLEGDNGTTEFLEADVFATLLAASIEYSIRIGGGSPP